jgi:septal ring-binding cell division protein DamX
VTPTGQQVKACSDNKRLAVVSADDPSGPVYLLSVTPAALKGLNQYQKELSVRGIPPEIVKTRVSFDTDASFPKLKFTFGGFLDADMQEVVDGLFGSEQVKEITGETLRTPVAVPQIARAAAPVAPRPAVKAAPPVEEPAPAPAPTQAAAPKRGFGASKPVAAPAAAPAPKAAAKAAAKPAAAPAADSASSLADEIAALVGEVNADDA